MNPNMPQEVIQEKPARVIPIKIGDVLCYPKFKCIHLTTPGQEQLKKDLHRYRFKELLIQLFENAQDYGASDEWLHFNICRIIRQFTFDLEIYKHDDFRLWRRQLLKSNAYRQ